jgi:hypothetical protein
MEKKVQIGISVTAAFLLVIGGELAWIHHKNNDVIKTPANPYATKFVADDNVFIRKEHPVTLKDEKDLIGKTIWVSAAAQLDYYPYKNHRADYAHPVGTLPGAEALKVNGVFEQVPPSTGRAVLRISKGIRHVLLSFTLPNSSDSKAEYAVPVGNYDTGGYTFLTDDIFFYDDPHKLYDFWGPAMWAHIDKHEPAIGMSENQAMLSLGEVMTPHGDKIGDRSVTYDNNGKPITMNFENNKATSISNK